MSVAPEERPATLLRLVGRKWALDANAEVNERRNAAPSDVRSLQFLIDHVGDHNQLMIDAIKFVSPTLDRLMHELMDVDPETAPPALYEAAYTAWTALANMCFREAEEVILGHDK